MGGGFGARERGRGRDRVIEYEILKMDYLSMRVLRRTGRNACMMGNFAGFQTL